MIKVYTMPLQEFCFLFSVCVSQSFRQSVKVLVGIGIDQENMVEDLLGLIILAQPFHCKPFDEGPVSFQVVLQYTSY